MPTNDWLEYVIKHTRADFLTGEVFWKIRLKGRRVNKPIGTIDSNGYIKTSVAKRKCYTHQIVFLHFYGYWPSMIDHINQKRSDNRPENLRETNFSKNALNSKLWKTNRTGVKGVSLTRDGRYKVTIQGIFYGYFNDLTSAKRVADGCYNRHSNNEH